VSLLERVTTRSAFSGMFERVTVPVAAPAPAVSEKEVGETVSASVGGGASLSATVRLADAVSSSAFGMLNRATQCVSEYPDSATTLPSGCSAMASICSNVLGCGGATNHPVPLNDR